MNKTVLKSFATQSRRKLIEQVQTKAFLYGIDEKNDLHIEEQFGQLLINGQTYPLSMKPAFTALQKQLDQKGYKQLLEEAAYTWFNRIIAIRYMEVHEYLPERVNVLSSSVGRVDPDILFEYDTMNLTIKQEKVRELVNAGNTEAAFRILFVAQCNALNRILPFMFEPIQDYTELLLPDFLLDAESVIKTLVQNEELTESFAEIEVIGWLYQYYIAEEKDRVFAQKSKYKKEEIPFATQLFTPKWIVQYMVQNSLGRYWTEAHREDEDLIDNWEYFIKHEEEDFYEKIAPYVNKELKVEDIKLLDPAMGSGHILVYAFEVFYEIYEKCGYPERDIPRLILENNLYGLDIDDRAYQLAAFALVMKAASFSKRFLRSIEREGIQLNVASIQETNHISDEVIAYIAQQEIGEQYNQAKVFFEQYYNAKTYGSLINITERDITFIEQRMAQIQNNPVEDLFHEEQHDIAKLVLPALIHQTIIMRNEYDVVVMNPPYMGPGSMNKVLVEFLKEYYPNSKNDLFGTFMEVYHYIKNKGFYAVINQQSWMFLSAFERLRRQVLDIYHIDTMLHLGPRAFDEISGEVVQSTTFVCRYDVKLDYLTTYFKLTDIKSSSLKEQTFKDTLMDKNSNIRFEFKQSYFNEIPRNSFIYWIPKNVLDIFSGNILNDFVYSDGQNKSGKNDVFLRYHWEVEKSKINSDYWLPFAKGGSFKKWHGNMEYVIDWRPQSREFYRKDKVARIIPEYLWYKQGITWSKITSNSPSFRMLESMATFDSTGPSIFLQDEDNYNYVFALLNSKVAEYFLNLFNPTLCYQVGDVINIPFRRNEENEIDLLVQENIKIVKQYNSIFVPDYRYEKKLNSYSEISIEQCFKTLNERVLEMKLKLKENEEHINDYFIELYGLDMILNKEVEEEHLSISIINEKEFIVNFFSEFLNEVFEITNYKGLLLTEKEYFYGDIISLLKDYLNKYFKKENLQQNLEWIANILNPKMNNETENCIRRYFLDEFFVDHCKMYQKRPIYWLVDSGKQKGLRTLIYMHRYQPDTMATIRFEHLQEIQAKYQQEIADLENRLVNPNLSATEKKRLNAEKVSFEKKIDELREFDKRLAAIAAEEIEIDLDDGVKVNYEKFYRGGKGVLAKIK